MNIEIMEKLIMPLVCIGGIIYLYIGHLKTKRLYRKIEEELNNFKPNYKQLGDKLSSDLCKKITTHQVERNIMEIKLDGGVLLGKINTDVKTDYKVILQAIEYYLNNPREEE